MIKHSLYRNLLAIVILMPVSDVMSEAISFDYVQAVYISDTIDPDGSIDDVEGDGIGFALSLSFEPAFAMRLAVSSTTFETFQGAGVDTAKTTALGVTAHTPVASGTEIFGNLSVVKAVVTVNDGAVSSGGTDFGGSIILGVRHLATDRLEVEMAASHINVFGHTVNSYMVGARVFIRKKASVGFGYSASDDVDSLLLNFRMNI